MTAATVVLGLSKDEKCKENTALVSRQVSGRYVVLRVSAAHLLCNETNIPIIRTQRGELAPNPRTEFAYKAYTSKAGITKVKARSNLAQSVHC